MKRLTFLALFLAGCSGGGNGGETDPCEGVECKAHSHCLEGNCVCNDGFHEEGGSCLPDDPCRFVVCDDNEHCDEDGACVCDAGYHLDGSVCVPDDACLDVTCGTDEQCVQGVCVPEFGDCCNLGTLDESGNEPVCVCDAGYNDSDGDLLCGPDEPADWPPQVEDLYSGATLLGDAECLLPTCHNCGHPGDFDLSGHWNRNSVTTISTCTNALVNGFDVRTIQGQEFTEENVNMGLFLGTCRWDTMSSPPREVGTAIGNTLATCWINERMMGVYSVEYEVVEYDPVSDTVSGPARVSLVAAEEKPELGVPCEFVMELTYTRQ